MQTFEWRFRLEGDELDLRAVVDAFKRELRLSEDEDKNLWLALSLPNGRGEERAAYEAARDWLSKINGILQVIHGDHESVTVGAIKSKSENGQWTGHHIVEKGLRLRLRGGTPAVAVSPAGQKVATIQEGPGDRLLEAASKNDAFDRAVYLYGCVPRNWRGLYMVLEAAEDGCGGQRMLEAKGWVGSKRITDFKKTANSFLAIGREARHCSTAQGIPAPEMTRDEAEDLVREILNRWAQYLS